MANLSACQFTNNEDMVPAVCFAVQYEGLSRILLCISNENSCHMMQNVINQLEIVFVNKAESVRMKSGSRYRRTLLKLSGS